MDYQRAKQILAEVAPELAAGVDTGLPHIDVYMADPDGKPIGNPFSIGLPRSTPDFQMTDADEQVVLIQGIQAAKRHFYA